MTDGPPDLANLRWFFDHLELREPDAANFAQQLVHREPGWERLHLGSLAEARAWLADLPSYGNA